MEGADEGLGDDRLDVLEGRVGDHVEDLVHQPPAELLEGVLGRVGPRVLENERLGFEGCQMVGSRGKGVKLHGVKSLSGVDVGARRLVTAPAPTARRPPQGL